MRLTTALMYYVRRRRIPGRLDIGKHQLVKPVTAKMKIDAANQLLVDYENQMYLQRPYLNEEEERYLHVIEEKYLQQQNAIMIDKRTRSQLHRAMTTDDHVSHLNVKKCWE